MKLNILNYSTNEWEEFGAIPFNVKDNNDEVEILLTNNNADYIYNLSLVTTIPSDVSIILYKYINNAWSSIGSDSGGAVSMAIGGVIRPSSSIRLKLKITSTTDNIDFYHNSLNFNYSLSPVDTTDLEFFLDFTDSSFSFNPESHSITYFGDYEDDIINSNSYASISKSDDGLFVSLGAMSSLSLFVKGYFLDVLDKTLFESGNLKISFNNNAELVLTIGSYVWTSSDFIKSSSVEYIIGISIDSSGNHLCTMNGSVMDGEHTGTITPILTVDPVYLFNNFSSPHNTACIGDYDYVSLSSSSVSLKSHGVINERYPS